MEKPLSDESFAPATVTIIIPNYNHSQYLDTAIKQACEQTRKADQVLVIDDGSTDNSVEIAKSYLDKYDNLSLMALEKNIGNLPALNQAMTSITSEYMCSIAADDILLPDFLEKSMAALERHPEAGMCFSNYSVLDEGTGQKLEKAYDIMAQGVFNAEKYPEYISPHEFVHFSARSIIWMTSNSVIIKKSMIDQAGGFKPEAKWYSDWLFYQTIAVRYGVCVIPENLTYIRAIPVSFSAAGMSDQKKQRDVLENVIALICSDDYKDLYDAIMRSPIILTALGEETYEVLKSKMTTWPMAWKLKLAFWALHFNKKTIAQRRYLRPLLDLFGVYGETCYAPPLKPLDNPTFGVVLANYNDADYLRSQLSCLTNQTRPLDELVIVDDGSSDESLEIIKEFQEKFPYIKVFQNPTNKGAIYSINRACQECTTDFVNWAASDDKVNKNFVEEAVTVLKRHPQAVICMSELATFTDENEELVPHSTISDVFDLAGAPEYLSPEEVKKWHEKRVLWISGNTTFFRLELLKAHGLYRQDLEWHADWFWGMMVSLRYGICIIPKVLCGLRTKPNSYSSAGLKNIKKRDRVLRSLVYILDHPNYRDIKEAVYEQPVLMSPLGFENMKSAYLFRPTMWGYLLRFVLWRIGYNAKHYKLSIPGYFKMLWITRCIRLLEKGDQRFGHIKAWNSLRNALKKSS